MNTVFVKKSYPKVLEGEFSILRSFYEQLATSESATKFFRIISENIIPLIRKSSQFRHLYEKWRMEIETYEKKWIDVQCKASKILEEIYNSILIELKKKKLQNNPEISFRIDIIESLIRYKYSLKNLRYFQNFSIQLKLIFNQILNLGGVSIIEPFAKIEKLENVSFQKVTGHTNNLLILSYVFDPIIEELSNLEKVLNLQDHEKPWAAFNKLLKAERAWNNQKEKFENNILIEEYSEWQDMKTLRAATSSKQSLFFKCENYLNYVEILMDEILIHQDTSTLTSNEYNTVRDHTIHSIYLDCKHNQLYLNLVGDDNQCFEKIRLHKFKEVSSPHDFFEVLISKGVGRTVDCENGGGTVSKHILDVKFPKIFTDLFIHKISKYKAALKSNPIILKEITKDETDLLYKQIDQLRVKNKKASKKKAKLKRTSK